MQARDGSNQGTARRKRVDWGGHVRAALGEGQDGEPPANLTPSGKPAPAADWCGELHGLLMTAAEQPVPKLWMEDGTTPIASVAMEAIKANPLAIDAYLALAAAISDAKSRAEVLRRGSRLAEVILGPGRYLEFEASAGSPNEGDAPSKQDLWLEGGLARTYLRLRAYLASSLWKAGHLEEALTEHENVLRLSPGDALGTRYRLAPRYIEAGQDQKCHQLIWSWMKVAPCARLLWTQVLLEWRGGTLEAELMLERAMAANPYVPRVLDAPRPRTLDPANHRAGSHEEAIFYVMEAGAAWSSAVGASEWVRSRVYGPN